MVLLKALRPLTGDYGKVSPGEIFEAEDDVAVSLESRGLAERFHFASKMQPAHENKMVKPEANKAWKLKVTPKEYLERHPKGPNAALARKLVKG